MQDKTKKIILKITISFVIIVTILVGLYFVFKALGLTDLTREELQEFISNSGAVAPLIFILVSFLQVTFVPIPGAITILAGNYLFGWTLSFIYSYIGMMLGAIFAWWLGKIAGRPYINWIAGGKAQANSWFKRLKGKETIFLFFAFLLPLFPDDLLCSVAGVLPIKFMTFLIIQLITRATSIGGTLLFMSGEVIPYHGWGIYVLIAIILVAIIAFILSLKYADKLNAFFDRITKALSSKTKRKK